MAYTTAQLVTAYTNANLGKAPDAATTLTLDAYATQSQTGGISDATALTNTLKLVNSTTAVAIETYQFFTGGAPSAAGLAYLVNSTTNANDLNDTYYAKFAQENRFINFSINLATGAGAGAAAFAASYGSVSIAQAVATAYDKIIGNAAATAAGVDPAAAVAYLTRADNIAYLTAFVKANTGFTAAADIDLAVKAALIGEILNAATVSGIGGYAKSTAAMINDLSDGVLSTDAAGGVNILTAYPNGGVVGSSLVLTTGVDTITGTVNDDTITALIDGTTGAVATTLTALDTINGGAGNDTINLNVLNGSGVAGTALAALPSVSISNVETANVRSAVGFTGDFSSWGVTSLNFTQGTTVALTAAATTNVAVSGATGATISVDGGLGVSVNDATAGNAITIGAGTGPKGAISVTDTAQTTGAIQIDGGTTVTVVASKVSTGSVTIGGTTAPTGVVSVASTGVAATAGAGATTLGAINVTGGTTVTVNQTASGDLSAQAKDASGATDKITQSAVNVTGTSTTTEVTVNQSAAQTGKNYVAAAGAKEVQTVTFTAMAAGDTVTVNGLTFTAAKALTAADVAAAFANLTAAATYGSAPVANGSYSGTFNTQAYVSGAVSGTTVTFTGSANGDLAGTIATAATGTATAPVATPVSDGVATTTGVTGVFGIVGGAVAVNGAIVGADVLTKVTLNGYGTGSTVASDALTTLNLANSKGTVAVTNTAATTLALGLSNVTGAAALNLGGTYTTLNVSTAVKSAAAITAGGVTALNVSGAAAVDLTGSAFAALKTVTVAGAGGVTIDASGATVTSVDTTASTGSNTVTLDASKATFTGGASADVVTLSSTTVSKAVALGDGDDTLVLASGTTSLGTAVSGGNGTDTLKMDAADAVTASLSGAFAAKFTGFERLALGALTGAASQVDLANMNNLAYVQLTGASTQALTLANFANGGTVELDAANTAATIVTLADATGTSDVLNLVTSNTGSVNVGTVQAAGVETIKLTATDTDTTTIDTHTVALTDAALKAVTISGNAKVVLTVGATSTLLTSVDASAATGAVTFATAATAASGATVLGGAGADVLTANHSNDVLNGGAGNDSLTVGANADLVTLTGGAGADAFKILNASSNVNSYATITDASAGDSLVFKAVGTNTFTSAKLALGDTAVFQDYANQAISTTSQGAITWFTYGGNTYVVEHVQAGGASFLNGTDIIVKLTGTSVDLSTASFGAASQTLVLH